MNINVSKICSVPLLQINIQDYYKTFSTFSVAILVFLPPIWATRLPASRYLKREVKNSLSIQGKKWKITLESLNHLQVCGDCDAISDRACNGTRFCMYFVSTSGLFILFSISFEIVGDVNSPNDQHIPILLNLTCGQTVKPAFTSGDSARFQRAT